MSVKQFELPEKVHSLWLVQQRSAHLHLWEQFTKHNVLKLPSTHAHEFNHHKHVY